MEEVNGIPTITNGDLLPLKSGRRKPLLLELIPTPTLGINVRSEVSPDEWDIIRRKVYKKANHICEICGEEKDSPVECHEVWSFYKKTRKQILRDLTCLCKRCHEVKHSRTESVKEFNFVMDYLMKINNWSRKRVISHIIKAKAIWAERSQTLWKVDISFIYKKGFLEK